jgi:hypothetical protein
LFGIAFVATWVRCAKGKFVGNLSGHPSSGFVTDPETDKFLLQSQKHKKKWLPIEMAA